MARSKKPTSKKPAMAARASRVNDAPSMLELDGLNRWHKLLAAVYALQGVAILILATAKSLPVTINYLGVDSLNSAAQRHDVYAQATQHLFDVRVSYLIAFVFFVAALAHVLAFGKLRFQYEQDMRHGLNRFGWLERGIAGGVMVATAALVAGISDVLSLLMILALAVVGGIAGLFMECCNRKVTTVEWKPYLLGSLVSFVPWVIVLMYLLGTQIYGSGVPAYLWWLFGSLVVLGRLAWLTTLVRFKKVGKWRRYVYAERAGLLVSFVTYAAFAWQVYAGILHP